MQAHEFEPMSIGGILDRTFRIYKNNFIRFIAIVAIIQVPVALLMIISTSILQSGAPARQEINYEHSKQDAKQNSENIDVEEFKARWERTTEGEPSPAPFLFGGMGIAVTGILSLLGQVLCRGALTKNVSESYLGNEITVGQAYRFVWPKFLTLIGAGILIVLVVYLGLLLLIVPGIIFGLWYALTTPAIVVENLKARMGMSRSKALVSGNLGKVFAVSFLIMAISWVVSIPFSFTGEFLGKTLFANSMMLMTFINQLLAVIGQILIVPIGAIAYILLYYDLRIRKEGFDLQMLANSIGSGQGDTNVTQP